MIPTDGPASLHDPATAAAPAAPGAALPPLHGIRVIDMSAVLMGPVASQVLADMGADVVKVESPEGDLTRQIGPARHPGMGAMFLNTNRHKRSVVLDLKQPAGLAAMRRLLADADVLMSNVRPRAMERLGLGYAAVAELNPRIVYASLVGFGQDGPYAAHPAYDDLIQGGSTLAHWVARASGGAPRYAPTALADRVVGLSAANAILGTLLGRARTGRGDRVEIPMFETMTGFVLADHFGGQTFDPPLDAGGYARQLSPDRRPYATADGHICALVYNDKQWQAFLQVVGRPTLPQEDPRFDGFANRMRHIDHVNATLAAWFAERPTAEWLQRLRAADIPCGPMHDLHSVQADPHLQAVGFFQPQQHPSEGAVRNLRPGVRWQQMQPPAWRGAPRLGEHTRALLAEAGLTEAEIEALLASGAARAADSGSDGHSDSGSAT